MNWSRVLAALVITVLVGSTAFADVKTEEKTLVQMEGMLGRMMRMLGGKAAKEGIVATVAVQGDRMARVTGDAGEIIDLAEEKVYQLDFKKKTYRPLTFAQMREQYEATMKQLEEQAKALRAAQESAASEQPRQELEMDVTVNETGQRKSVAGHECREVVSTVTTRVKGKTLEQGGGLVVTSTLWLAPKVPAIQEVLAFQQKYAQKLMGPALIAAAQEMATVVALYPGTQDALRRAKEEVLKLDGTPLLTVTKVESVPSPEQVAQREQAGREADDAEPAPTSVSGLGGMLGKKLAKKKTEEPKPQGAGNRVPVMTATTEYLRISDAVAPADVAIPAGFRERGQPQ